MWNFHYLPQDLDRREKRTHADGWMDKRPRVLRCEDLSSHSPHTERKFSAATKILNMLSTTKIIPLLSGQFSNSADIHGVHTSFLVRSLSPLRLSPLLHFLLPLITSSEGEAPRDIIQNGAAYCLLGFEGENLGSSPAGGLLL